MSRTLVAPKPFSWTTRNPASRICSLFDALLMQPSWTSVFICQASSSMDARARHEAAASSTAAFLTASRSFRNPGHIGPDRRFLASRRPVHRLHVDHEAVLHVVTDHSVERPLNVAHRDGLDVGDNVLGRAEIQHL